MFDIYIDCLKIKCVLVSVVSCSGCIVWMVGFICCWKFIYIFFGMNGDFFVIVKFNNYFFVISLVGRCMVCFDSCMGFFK